MGIIQAIYFQHTPAHKKPARAEAGGASNRGLRGSAKDRSGRYAIADDARYFFRHKVLPKLEMARQRGDVVRFLNGQWFINGEQVKV